MKNKNLVNVIKICIISILLFLIPLTGCIKSGEKQQPPPFIINGRVVYSKQTYTLSSHSPAYIVGVIIENKTSFAYIWYPKNKSMDIKIAYTPPKNVIPIFQQVLSLNITFPYTEEKVVSGREILPFNFRYDEGRKGWLFEYSAGWHAEPEDKQFVDGGAIYYPNNQTVLMEWCVN